MSLWTSLSSTGGCVNLRCLCNTCSCHWGLCSSSWRWGCRYVRPSRQHWSWWVTENLYACGCMCLNIFSTTVPEKMYQFVCMRIFVHLLVVSSFNQGFISRLCAGTVGVQICSSLLLVSGQYFCCCYGDWRQYSCFYVIVWRHRWICPFLCYGEGFCGRLVVFSKSRLSCGLFLRFIMWIYLIFPSVVWPFFHNRYFWSGLELHFHYYQNSQMLFIPSSHLLWL